MTQAENASSPCFFGLNYNGSFCLFILKNQLCTYLKLNSAAKIQSLSLCLREAWLCILSFGIRLSVRGSTCELLSPCTLWWINKWSICSNQLKRIYVVLGVKSPIEDYCQQHKKDNQRGSGALSILLKKLVMLVFLI